MMMFFKYFNLCCLLQYHVMIFFYGKLVIYALEEVVIPSLLFHFVYTDILYFCLYNRTILLCGHDLIHTANSSYPGQQYKSRHANGEFPSSNFQHCNCLVLLIKLFFWFSVVIYIDTAILINKTMIMDVITFP